MKDHMIEELISIFRFENIQRSFLNKYNNF